MQNHTPNECSFHVGYLDVEFILNCRKIKDLNVNSSIIEKVLEKSNEVEMKKEEGKLFIR